MVGAERAGDLDAEALREHRRQRRHLHLPEARQRAEPAPQIGRVPRPGRGTWPEGPRWRQTHVRSYAHAVDPLAVFSPPTRAWFEATFDAPTPAQEKGWPVIASGAHTLIQAPTGSGKTLAAFLYAIDRLTPSPGEGLRVVYVSPRKALNYDVERNLRGPLA